MPVAAMRQAVQSHGVRMPRTLGLFVARASPQRRDEARWMSPSGRALIVDPCESWATVLAASFRALGYEPQWHAALSTAISSLEAQQPAIVCSEVKLGTAAWHDLLVSIRARNASTKLVLISSRLTPISAFEAMRLGCDLILTKPALAQDVLVGLGPRRLESPLSLDKAKTLYIDRTVNRCDTMAEAARELAVSSRSLRRMLVRRSQLHSKPENDAR